MGLVKQDKHLVSTGRSPEEAIQQIVSYSKELGAPFRLIHFYEPKPIANKHDYIIVAELFIAPSAARMAGVNSTEDTIEKLNHIHKE